MLKKFVFAAALMLVVSNNAFCSVISQWTFETSQPATAGPFAAEVGTGFASGFHANAATVYSSPVGNGSARSFSSNTWSVGDYYQFTTSTTGSSNIGVTFDQISSNTGPRDFALSYSVDGTNFTNFASYIVIANATPNVWTSGAIITGSNYSFNLSAVAALNNAASVTFRLIDTSAISANGSAVATAGTSRVDNFTVISAVPEPTSIALVGMVGCVGLVCVVRRRQANRNVNTSGHRAA